MVSGDEYNQFIENIVSAKKEFSLIIFIGAGVSISQGYPDWNHYVSQLISYWTFNLKSLTDIPDTKKQKPEISDMKVLETLAISSVSNKRKVDLVNFLVKKYCETDDIERSNQIFREHVLDFEKFIFNYATPTSLNNEILDKLVELRAAFITTNYDSQIKESYSRNLSINPEIYKNVNLISGNIKRELVVHLHGVPDGDPRFFISSSKSYSSMYYNSDIYKRKVKELFKEKDDALILFVGCSMEEDEVLSILDMEETRIKFYALMKKSTNNSDSNFDQFVKEYYQSQNKVDFIWYGENYLDLPRFIKTLVADVTSKESETINTPDDIWEAISDEQ